MKALLTSLCLTACAFAGLFSPNVETPETKPATIKVLLKKHSEGALIEAKGPYLVFNPFDNKKLSSGWSGKRFYLHAHDQGIKWGEDFPGIYQLRLVPKNPNTTFLVDGMQVQGCLEVYHIDGAVHIVNEVDVENYLKSVLTTHLSQEHLHPDVLDALAIAMRTDAYYHAMRSSDAFWQVNASDVGYTGCGLILQNLGIDRAVDATRYLVMSYEGHPFPTAWTPNCAGKTGSYRDIFRRNISTPSGVKTPFAQKVRDEHTWTFSLPKERLAHLAKTNRVTDIDLFIDGTSSKTYGLRIRDGSHSANVDFFALQQALGPQNIKSNDFTVKIENNNVIFSGFGEGHGVGLCLFSATQMAEKGELAPEILATFFPYTHIQQQRTLPSPSIAFEEHHTLETN